MTAIFPALTTDKHGITREKSGEIAAINLAHLQGGTVVRITVTGDEEPTLTLVITSTGHPVASDDQETTRMSGVVVLGRMSEAGGMVTDLHALDDVICDTKVDTVTSFNVMIGDDFYYVRPRHITITPIPFGSLPAS